METRISKKFEELKSQNRKALIPFFMPGAQGELSIEEIIIKIENAGADLIELGIPFSDPVADGPTIQKSAQVALEKKIHTDNVLEAISNARKKTQVPILLLVYYNSIFKYGCEKFANACYDAGVDGLIIPDLPFEEAGEMKMHTKDLPIDIISLAARTSKARLKMVLSETEGFVYCVSTVGVTGERSAVYSELSAFLDSIKEITSTPRAVGFGISTTEQAAQISKLSEGVIVGSALCRRLLEEGSEAGIKFVADLREAIDKAQKT